MESRANRRKGAGLVAEVVSVSARAQSAALRSMVMFKTYGRSMVHQPQIDAPVPPVVLMTTDHIVARLVVCGTAKCENYAKCENSAKCENKPTLNVKITLNVKNQR